MFSHFSAFTIYHRIIYSCCICMYFYALHYCCVYFYLFFKSVFFDESIRLERFFLLYLFYIEYWNGHTLNTRQQTTNTTDLSHFHNMKCIYVCVCACMWERESVCICCLSFNPEPNTLMRQSKWERQKHGGNLLTLRKKIASFIR